MCIQTLNLQASKPNVGEQAGHIHEIPSTPVLRDLDADPEIFYYWPFYWRTAISNLDRLGAGPWPYWASATYFVGVLCFGVGLIIEFMPLKEEVIGFGVASCFTIGSFFFVVGGVCECIENESFKFTTCKPSHGWCGAWLNFIGSVLFLIGSVMDFFPDKTILYISSFLFGIGAGAFALGSAVQIVMWKDEQFGLTYLGVLNQLGGPSGRPVVLRQTVDSEALEEEQTFTWRGAMFVMIYGAAATVSVYNSLTALTNIGRGRRSAMIYVERSFNALLPCIFAHLLLGVNSAVIRMPRQAPFRQLYIGCRWLALLMIAFGTANLVQTIMAADHMA